MFKNETNITAVEIGGSKICAIMGVSDEGAVSKLTGFVERRIDRHNCKGDILDQGKVAREVKEAIQAVERDAAADVDRRHLYLGVTGGHIRSAESRGSVIITDDDKLIKPWHLDEAVRKAYQASFGPEREIISNFDAQYVLDNDPERCFAHPLGQAADKMEALVLIVHGNQNRILTARSTLVDAGFDAEDVYPLFNGLANVFGCVERRGQEDGTLLIDIGASVTEYTLVRNMGIIRSGVVTVGAEHVVNDLAVGLDLSADVCRGIVESRSYVTDRDNGEVFLDIAGRRVVRSVPVTSIYRIVDMRLEELFAIVRAQVGSLEDKPIAQVMLSGGGALIPSSVELAKRIFNLPVVLGVPRSGDGGTVNSLDGPRHNTIWGLLRYGALVSEFGRFNHQSKNLINRSISLLDRPASKFIRMLSNLKNSIKI